MNKDHEVRSSNYNYNMASWCTEKSDNIVKCLSSIVELIGNNPNVSGKLREDVELYLAPALWDATKMLSFSCGAEWSTEDRDLIMENGKCGYNELIKKYKCK